MESIVKKIKYVFAVIVTISTMLLAGCQEGAGDADYGFGYIYIPQATFTGLNNHFPVPGGAGVNTYNFKVDTLANGTPDKLQIILGVYRAGKISDAGGFTVNVDVLSAMTDEAVTEIDDSLPLPQSMYSIPNKAGVEAGTNSVSFYLTVNVNQLTDVNYAGKKLVLAVGISNPTSYELAEDNTSVVVVIDVDAILDIILLSNE